MNPLNKVLANPFTRIPFFLAVAVGAVTGIAGGFLATYELVLMIGARW